MSNGRASRYEERISNAARWAIAHLETYCAPGTHTLRDAGVDGWEWCTCCYKEQRSDGTSCLVCDQPGVIAVEVVQGPRNRKVRGVVCGDCFDGLAEVSTEFSLRPVSSGRRVRPAVPAS